MQNPNSSQKRKTQIGKNCSKKKSNLVLKTRDFTSIKELYITLISVRLANTNNSPGTWHVTSKTILRKNEQVRRR